MASFEKRLANEAVAATALEATKTPWELESFWKEPPNHHHDQHDHHDQHHQYGFSMIKMISMIIHLKEIWSKRAMRSNARNLGEESKSEQHSEKNNDYSEDSEKNMNLDQKTKKMMETQTTRMINTLKME